MATWAADGTMAGYDSLTRRLKEGLYHFATTGSVDVGAVTRLNSEIEAGLNRTTYPNTLQIEVPFRFSAADFTNNPNRKLGLGMLLVRSNQFPEGHIPTATELFNAQYDFAMRGNWAMTAASEHVIGFDMPKNMSYYWNTKWWVLIYPSAIINTNAVWSRTNDAPIKGISINSIARAISFWGDRTPGKPAITSPVHGSSWDPGSEFTLQITPNDPDALAPPDAERYNADVNGVEFQYRAAPTAENPDPTWNGLPFDWIWREEPDRLRRDEAWHIRGSRWWGGLLGTPYHNDLVTNLGCKVRVGVSGNEEITPGSGSLPQGEWQIRGRTFDYGHPYPNSGTKVTEPGPLGINPAVTGLNEPANAVYPAGNTSPWSDPIRVSVPTQVPAPLPNYPKNDAAVPVSSNVDNPFVRLRWNYRNTHQPPRDQYRAQVQIRKVGDLDWATVQDAAFSEDYFDLPFDHNPVDVPPLDLLPNGGFETGTLAGWLPDPLLVAPVIHNIINDPTKAHSGNYCINPYLPPADVAAGYGIVTTYTNILSSDIPEDYTEFTFDFWAYFPPATRGWVSFNMYWIDENGLIIQGPTIPHPDFNFDVIDPEWAYFTVHQTQPELGAGGWKQPLTMNPREAWRRFHNLKRHPEGYALQIVMAGLQDNLDENDLWVSSDWRYDDISLIASGTPRDPFTIEVGNQYEWRVKVIDTDYVESPYSTPARFWMVPGAGTGEVRPVPSETIEGATLGCGTHHVEVFRRGGKQRVGELTSLSRIDYSRVRDDISTAKIDVSGWDIDCGNLLARLQTWAYEIVIYRDNGFSVDRVWEGPITLLTYENDMVTIHAKDVMAYAYRRIIKQKMTDSGTGNGTTVVDRARRVLQNVFAADDPNVLAYLQVIERTDDAMQYRSTPAYSRTAFEEVDDMAANAGLDYTALGRSIMLWGTKHRIGTLPEFRDENLGASPIVSEYGMSMATAYSVSDGNGVHGEAYRGSDQVSGNDETYGLIEMLSSTWASDSEDESGTYTQQGLETVIKSFKEFADRSISDRFPPPVVVRIPDNTTLNPDTVISMQHLVPGVVVPLRSTSTLRSVTASQKLDSVKVVEEKGVETVSITLSPFSRDDASMDGGEE